ncbi:MAG: sulfur carrier protein ThiS adenylyltransferase ThiF [Candidatus Methanoplasma sp.]|nr:sulfur carrier protein ThiS adenylyltransferase ThiF [Candidatus Methanoplasma sp.]
MLPEKSELEGALCARYPPEIFAVLKKAKVGIAGLGGLGSNVAMMLARAGISDLIIADLDRVDISNINRQNYSLDQIGMEKTEATEIQLRNINPYIHIEKHNVRLNPSNIPEIFKGCDIVCEAFDIPSEKAMLINTLLERCPDTAVVSGSGMAGFGRSNDIRTEKLFANLYICGDGVDMEDVEGGLMSPRVNICAGHMANTVMSLLLNGEL